MQAIVKLRRGEIDLLDCYIFCICLFVFSHFLMQPPLLLNIFAVIFQCLFLFLQYEKRLKISILGQDALF